MPRILLTNDDSHRSPLLAIAIEVCKRFGDLTVVVPKEEQSWRGKAITRYGSLHLERCTLFGFPSYTLTGTPADCASVALYHLFDELPDLVVSGINAGLNTGSGFAFSSGTIGACLESNVAGVPGLALSQEFDSATWAGYTSTYLIDSAIIERFSRQIVPRLERLLESLLAPAGRSEPPITWSVNFPFVCADDAPFVSAPLGNTNYGRIFREDPGFPGGRVFSHHLQEIRYDPRPEADHLQLRGGKITVTPLEMRQFGQQHPDTARFLGDLNRSIG